MQNSPFSLLVDGSNDTGLEKLNPLTVKIFDATNRQVCTGLLDMCTTSGPNCGTALAIFNKINSVLEQYNIPWERCVSFGVDNTSVNLGKHHSIMTLVHGKNSECYFMGCPCHLVHNIASHASMTSNKVSGFDVEDLCIDVFYWFDASTKRKGILKDFCTFCDSDYHEIVRYVSVRWLSLEKAVFTILQLLKSLTSYFKSEEQPQARFKRLQTAFQNPMTEVYLLFYESDFPIFTRINLLLQREDPCIHLIASTIRDFLLKLFSKFISIQAIKATEDITKVEYENQLSDSQITIGLVTKSCLRKLLEDGDISVNNEKKFYTCVRAFYIDAATQAIRKLPFDDIMLKHAQFVNFEHRENCSFESVKFFCTKYSNLLTFTTVQMDNLQEQFVAYQLLHKADIPETIWEESLTTEKETESGQTIQYHRMDILWSYLSEVKCMDGSLKYENLAKVAKLVLIIPHSNILVRKGSSI